MVSADLIWQLCSDPSRFIFLSIWLGNGNIWFLAFQEFWMIKRETEDLWSFSHYQHPTRPPRKTPIPGTTSSTGKWNSKRSLRRQGPWKPSSAMPVERPRLDPHSSLCFLPGALLLIHTALRMETITETLRSCTTKEHTTEKPGITCLMASE